MILWYGFVLALIYTYGKSIKYPQLILFNNKVYLFTARQKNWNPVQDNSCYVTDMHCIEIFHTTFYFPIPTLSTSCIYIFLSLLLTCLYDHLRQSEKYTMVKLWQNNKFAFGFSFHSLDKFLQVRHIIVMFLDYIQCSKSEWKPT